ncbi:sugar ABC transporter substrate-binding protein [Cytobacillus oceanisediminis]|uniref:sugar ABC transporter substrate-binding protein n=1 Tax=Cytobacillus oceanisediminis TaxID=665099 RepID=UPI001C220333|nr:sugar ABC transporter substrate-binding protein [Cytobacillus oceanisediminis]MBU8771399.1 sugar ABC transporter substrate-binding protein [Cytobacillus oceanisediminis]
MKKFISLFLVAMLTIGLAACSGNEGASGGSGGDGEKEEQLVFGYTSMTQNNPFFQVLEEAIREEVEANGDKLITTNPAMDVSLQINQIEDMIAQGIDAIFLNPVDWEGIRPALAMLEEAGIPIINYDTEVKDFDYVTAYVGSDNKNAGRVAGEDLVKRFPNGGKIAVLDSPTMNSINDRIAGFMEAIEGKNFDIVAQQDAKGDLETALGITEDILQAHPDIIAIMGGNDPTALGALAAAKAANKTDLAIYGVDGSPDAKAAIAEGGPLVGTGAQSPISIGKQSVEVAYKILNKEEFEKRVPVETFLINEENVEEYGTDGWQ